MPAISVEATTFALFGALGDLALRKLFPALYQLDRAGLLNGATRLLALSRDDGEPEAHLTRIDEALRRYVPPHELDERVLDRFRSRLQYLTMDFRRGEDYQALAERVDPGLPLIAYFATPAQSTATSAGTWRPPASPSEPGWRWRSRSATTWRLRAW